MSSNRFFKAHSLGNDFILISTNDLNSIDSDFVLHYNHRFFGIGCNQLLVIDHNNNVRIWNENGSLAHLCGNGLRCLAKLLNKPSLILNTEFAGPIELHTLKNGLVSTKVKYTPTISFNNDHYLVDVGNLNKIFFVDDNSKIDIDSFANTEFNFSFISRKDEKWIIRTIESCTKHETYACGSASLASAYAIHEKGYHDLTLNFRLGPIFHHIENDIIIQIGPATIVAELFFK